MVMEGLLSDDGRAVGRGNVSAVNIEALALGSPKGQSEIDDVNIEAR
jgi:hypothetical protein